MGPTSLKSGGCRARVSGFWVLGFEKISQLYDRYRARVGTSCNVAGRYALAQLRVPGVRQ